MASFTLHGIPVSRGIAIGRAHLLRRAALDVTHYLVAHEHIEAEVARLQNAIDTVQNELQTLWQDLPQDAPSELGAFIDVHALILSDPMISNASMDIIRSRHYNAEWALLTQIDELTAQFNEIEDIYLRERKSDIEQVAERILKALLGTACENQNANPSSNDNVHMIVIAHDISPSDMLQFRGSAFAGFVTELGGQNSHTAIVARSLNIPAAVGVTNASELIVQNDCIVIDGDAGIVIVDPSQAVIAQYREEQNKQLRSRKKLNKLKKMPTITRDGTRIELLANVELPEDCAAALNAGAEGVGLFRTEFLFMSRLAKDQPVPDEKEQYLAYRDMVCAMKGARVTIRTLDCGADKPINAEEQISLNPALGLRAIRYCLAEPRIFLTQLRAILRASAHGPVNLMIPMLAHSFEIDQTLALIAQAKNQLRDLRIKFDEAIPVGAVIEVPAAALTLPIFIKRMNFLSIGTNDLIQYTLAIDRVDHEVAHLYNPMHPAVLQLIALTIKTANKSGIPVGVCGEMAGDIKFTRLLLGMGLRQFSMHPAQLLPVKQEIINSNIDALTRQTAKLLRTQDPASIAKAARALQATDAADLESDILIRSNATNL